MGEGGEEKALSLFRFHLSPFPPETPDTQANSTRIPAFTGISVSNVQRFPRYFIYLLTTKKTILIITAPD